MHTQCNSKFAPFVVLHVSVRNQRAYRRVDGIVYLETTELRLVSQLLEHKPNTVLYFFVIKPTRSTNFTNLFCHEILRVSDSSSVHHHEFIHCTFRNGICHTGLQTAFEQDNVLLESSLQTSMTYTISECTVNKLVMMNRRTVRNTQNFMTK